MYFLWVHLFYLIWSLGECTSSLPNMVTSLELQVGVLRFTGFVSHAIIDGLSVDGPVGSTCCGRYEIAFFVVG